MTQGQKNNRAVYSASSSGLQDGKGVAFAPYRGSCVQPAPAETLHAHLWNRCYARTGVLLVNELVALPTWSNSRDIILEGAAGDPYYVHLLSYQEHAL